METIHFYLNSTPSIFSNWLIHITHHVGLLPNNSDDLEVGLEGARVSHVNNQFIVSWRGYIIRTIEDDPSKGRLTDIPNAIRFKIVELSSNKIEVYSRVSSHYFVDYFLGLLGDIKERWSETEGPIRKFFEEYIDYSHEREVLLQQTKEKVVGEVPTPIELLELQFLGSPSEFGVFAKYFLENIFPLYIPHENSKDYHVISYDLETGGNIVLFPEPLSNPVEVKIYRQWVSREMPGRKIGMGSITAQKIGEGNSKITVRVLIPGLWEPMLEEMKRQGWVNGDKQNFIQTNAQSNILEKNLAKWFPKDKTKFKKIYNVMKKLREDYSQDFLDENSTKPEPTIDDLRARLSFLGYTNLAKLGDRRLKDAIKAGDKGWLK